MGIDSVLLLWDVSEVTAKVVMVGVAIAAITFNDTVKYLAIVSDPISKAKAVGRCGNWITHSLSVSQRMKLDIIEAG